MKIKSLDIPCMSYRSGNPSDGYEYECEYYENSGICIECDECICNCGYVNPINGKRINFILRCIQNIRANRCHIII